MSYFLRFTEDAYRDLEKGYSYLDLPSLKTPKKLNGLCGYSFCTSEEIDYNILSEEEIEKRVNDYKNNVWYNGTATLFKGEYISQNSNSEGVIFQATEIYKQF